MTESNKQDEPCAHTQIIAWRIEETGEPAGLWSCASCFRKFTPAALATPSAPARQAVRMLTGDEVKAACAGIFLSDHIGQPGSQSYDDAIAEAIQHKFCEVNGLEMNNAND